MAARFDEILAKVRKNLRNEEGLDVVYLVGRPLTAAQAGAKVVAENPKVRRAAELYADRMRDESGLNIGDVWLTVSLAVVGFVASNTPKEVEDFEDIVPIFAVVQAVQGYVAKKSGNKVSDSDLSDLVQSVLEGVDKMLP